MIVLKNLLFSVLVPGSVAGLLPYWIASATGRWQWPDPGLLQLVGVLVSGAGLAIYLRCVTDFGSAGGTPAPIDPPRELVVRGLYRYSRNPMYLGVLSVLVGEALFLESPHLALYACAVFGLFHAFVVLYEEPVLRRRFGDSHERLCARVPRWIGLPRDAG